MTNTPKVFWVYQRDPIKNEKPLYKFYRNNEYQFYVESEEIAQKILSVLIKGERYNCPMTALVQSRDQVLLDVLNNLENSDIPMKVLPIPDGKNESFRWVRLIDIIDIIESFRTQGSRDP